MPSSRGLAGKLLVLLLSHQWLTNNAMLVGACRDCCQDWKGPFSMNEFDKLCVTLILNGLHPYPSLRDYFEGDSFAFGDINIKNMWGMGVTGY